MFDGFHDLNKTRYCFCDYKYVSKHGKSNLVAGKTGLKIPSNFKGVSCGVFLKNLWKRDPCMVMVTGRSFFNHGFFFKVQLWKVSLRRILKDIRASWNV